MSLLPWTSFGSDLQWVTEETHWRLSHPRLSHLPGRCPTKAHRKHAGAECFPWARGIFRLSGISAWLHHFSGYRRGLLAVCSHTPLKHPGTFTVKQKYLQYWKPLGLFTGLELDEPKSWRRPQRNTAHHTSPGDKVWIWWDILVQ